MPCPPPEPVGITAEYQEGMPGMSRYCGEKNPDPILKAAEHWKSVALLRGGSVLSEKSLWTRKNFEAIDQYYVRRPNEGRGRFHEKLKDQLAPAEAAVKQLVAEMLWLMYLCPSSINSSHKRNVIARVWLWSGEKLSLESPWLRDDVLAGIGSAGPGFNQNQWRELVFFTRFVLRFQELQLTQQQSLLADPEQFADWIELIEDARFRQLRHMLVFLLFPDSSERIFGRRDREAVAVVFSSYNKQHVSALGPAALDKLLRQTREKLEKQYGTKELDYYLPPLVERWKGTAVSAVAGDLAAEHVQKAIADIDRDGVPADARSMKYQLIYAGKRYPARLVLSLATGYATGEALDLSSLGDTEESAEFNALRKLGLFVEPNDAMEVLVKKFFGASKQAKRSWVQRLPKAVPRAHHKGELWQRERGQNPLDRLPR